MSNKARTNGANGSSPHREIDSLYLDLVTKFYDDEDRAAARPIAERLEKLLAEAPEFDDSIRREEIRSLVAELRGDLREAVQCREAEIRKILELHALAANTPSWSYVSRRYDFADVSDRLDLLAILYDDLGELDRAIDVLHESKRYCESHALTFQSRSLLAELTRAKTRQAKKRRFVGQKEVKISEYLT